MTKSITNFDIVLVPFPFTDLSTSKKRPCMVLLRLEPVRVEMLFLVAMITSQIDGLSFPFDVKLKDPEQAGLIKPSLVRLSKMVTIDQSLINKKLGRLSLKDQEIIKQNIHKMFKHLLIS
ncbi:MAG: type II toxin-antitoxin system PemK/MazF family toxin [Deltaproteobacteria bacterium]|nr:type II toxin-antitoxin system PemK/MazF family toxin [Deltaproteobacteria bacterium]